MMEIKTEKFSGPFGLLLSLIEKEELDITEISLAKIADEYVNYIQANDISPEQIADFLMIAAKLLYIKSKALLPYLSNQEADEEIEDLERQLKIYKEFLDASKKIEQILAGKKFAFFKENGKFTRRSLLFLQKFSPPKKLTISDLQAVYLDLLLRSQEYIQKLKEERLEKKINIEEKIGEIQKLLVSGKNISFKNILQGNYSKTEVIVNFLALLELAKQKELVFEQSELFGDIIINKYL